MVDIESIPAEIPTLDDLVPMVKIQSDRAYELALELSSILEAFNELEEPPKMVFTISRMADRVTEIADTLHCNCLRLAHRYEEQRGQGVKPLGQQPEDS